MCCVSVGLWKSLSSLSIASRSCTGPRAAIQPTRSPPPTVFDSEST